MVKDREGLKTYSVRAEDINLVDPWVRLSARAFQFYLLRLSALSRRMEGFALDSFQTGKAAQAWRDASLLLTQAARSVVYQAELDTRIAATLALMVRDHLLQLLPLEKEAVR